MLCNSCPAEPVSVTRGSSAKSSRGAPAATLPALGSLGTRLQEPRSVKRRSSCSSARGPLCVVARAAMHCTKALEAMIIATPRAREDVILKGRETADGALYGGHHDILRQPVQEVKPMALCFIMAISSEFVVAHIAFTLHALFDFSLQLLRNYPCAETLLLWFVGQARKSIGSASAR